MIINSQKKAIKLCLPFPALSNFLAEIPKMLFNDYD